MRKFLFLVVFISQTGWANTRQDPKCAGQHFMCLRECTRDLKRTQEECEQPSQCGKLDQCDVPVPPATPAGKEAQGPSPELLACDEDMGKGVRRCEDVAAAKEGLTCLRGVLAEYRSCVKAIGNKPKPAKPAKAVR